MVEEFRFFCGGLWKKGKEQLPVTNPSNQEVLGLVHLAAKEDINLAIRRAKEASKVMRSLSKWERTQILEKIAGRLWDDKSELTKLLSRESGKPIPSAVNEVDECALIFNLAVRETDRLGSDFIPLDNRSHSDKGRFALDRRFPLGIIAGITPFNSPLRAAAQKIAPAIATGNSIIIKPSSQTPLSALALTRIIEASGLPEGAFSLLPCRTEIGEHLVREPNIGMLAFTGSARIGWYLHNIAGKKRVTLALGGNAGIIVHKDADIGHAISECAKGAFQDAGQSCVSAQRIYVHQEIWEEFTKGLVSIAQESTFGDPLEEDSHVPGPMINNGPMINSKEIFRIEQWVKEALEGGAKLLAGGVRDGVYYSSTILTDVNPHQKVAKEEVMAPVVVLTPYLDWQKAIQSVNDSRFGLQASLFSKDMRIIMEAFSTVEVGSLLINEASKLFHALPHGGIKDSGIGREGCRYAMEEMTTGRVICLQGM